MKLAFITNLGPSEFALILVLSVLIFGRRLPEVAARGAVHLQRLRRGIRDFRRESGFDDEIRRARQLVENPIKGALDEVGEERWRPPSPRIGAHPEALESAPVNNDEDLDKASSLTVNSPQKVHVEDNDAETRIDL